MKKMVKMVKMAPSRCNRFNTYTVTPRFFPAWHPRLCLGTPEDSMQKTAPLTREAKCEKTARSGVKSGVYVLLRV